jgi:hypothetical protein
MYLEEHKDKVSEITAAILSAVTDLVESRKSPTKKDDDSASSNEGGDGTCGESLSCLRVHGPLGGIDEDRKGAGQESCEKLHDLLPKLMTEPTFKFEFAKAFIRYYPVTISEVIKGSSDSLLEEYRLIPTFSVQIFTVPPLTTRLVREHNLLGVLLESLTVLFLSCVGEDGRLQVCLASPFRFSRKLKCLCFTQLLCTDGIFLLFEHN